MREIKFRQYLGKGNFHYFGFKNGICEGVAEASLDKYPISQFTGLKDKNGKYIYEGDIVNHGDNFDSVVFWSSSDAAFRIRELGIVDGEQASREHDMNAYTNPMIILGNIYKNPEHL